MPLPSDFVPRCKEFNIITVSSGRPHRIAKIIFGSDGSIYVTFPSFSRSDGLAAVLTLAGNAKYPASLDLAKYGKVTGHRVKYSHHPDGLAHFSQKKKVRSEIRRKACPLNLQIGHLFTIQLQGLYAFNPPRPSDRAHPIFITIEGEIRILKIVCFRTQLSKIQTNLVGQRQGRPIFMRTRDGSLRSGMAIAPPQESPFGDSMLFLIPEEVIPSSEDQEPFLMFLGGFDYYKAALDLSQDTSFLGLLYPCSDFNKLRSMIGTIDLPSFQAE
jgi:hypothetical protein